MAKNLYFMFKRTYFSARDFDEDDSDSFFVSHYKARCGNIIITDNNLLDVLITNTFNNPFPEIANSYSNGKKVVLAQLRKDFAFIRCIINNICLLDPFSKNTEKIFKIFQKYNEYNLNGRDFNAYINFSRSLRKALYSNNDFFTMLSAIEPREGNSLPFVMARLAQHIDYLKKRCKGKPLPDIIYIYDYCLVDDNDYYYTYEQFIEIQTHRERLYALLQHFAKIDGAVPMLLDETEINLHKMKIFKKPFLMQGEFGVFEESLIKFMFSVNKLLFHNILSDIVKGIARYATASEVNVNLLLRNYKVLDKEISAIYHDFSHLDYKMQGKRRDHVIIQKDLMQYYQVTKNATNLSTLFLLSDSFMELHLHFDVIHYVPHLIMLNDYARGAGYPPITLLLLVFLATYHSKVVNEPREQLFYYYLSYFAKFDYVGDTCRFTKEEGDACAVFIYKEEEKWFQLYKHSFLQRDFKAMLFVRPLCPQTNLWVPPFARYPWVHLEPLLQCKQYGPESFVLLINKHMTDNPEMCLKHEALYNSILLFYKEVENVITISNNDQKLLHIVKPFMKYFDIGKSPMEDFQRGTRKYEILSYLRAILEDFLNTNFTKGSLIISRIMSCYYAYGRAEYYEAFDSPHDGIVTSYQDYFKALQDKLSVNTMIHDFITENKNGLISAIKQMDTSIHYNPAASRLKIYLLVNPEKYTYISQKTWDDLKKMWDHLKGDDLLYRKADLLYRKYKLLYHVHHYPFRIIEQDDPVEKINLEELLLTEFPELYITLDLNIHHVITQSRIRASSRTHIGFFNPGAKGFIANHLKREKDLRKIIEEFLPWYDSIKK